MPENYCTFVLLWEPRRVCGFPAVTTSPTRCEAHRRPGGATLPCSWLTETGDRCWEPSDGGPWPYRCQAHRGAGHSRAVEEGLDSYPGSGYSEAMPANPSDYNCRTCGEEFSTVTEALNHGCPTSEARVASASAARTIVNRFPGACRLCGQNVPAATGVAVQDETTRRWSVEHTQPCPSAPRVRTGDYEVDGTQYRVLFLEDGITRTVRRYYRASGDYVGLTAVNRRLAWEAIARAYPGAVLNPHQGTTAESNGETVTAPTFAGGHVPVAAAAPEFEVPAGYYYIEVADGSHRRYRITERRTRYGSVRRSAAVAYSNGGRWMTSGIRSVENAVREAVRNGRSLRELTVAYGQHTGSCGVCGRTLTDPESIARHIGPVCASRRGWA